MVNIMPGQGTSNQFNSSLTRKTEKVWWKYHCGSFNNLLVLLRQAAQTRQISCKRGQHSYNPQPLSWFLQNLINITFQKDRHDSVSLSSVDSRWWRGWRCSGWRSSSCSWVSPLCPEVRVWWSRYLAPSTTHSGVCRRETSIKRDPLKTEWNDWKSLNFAIHFGTHAGSPNCRDEWVLPVKPGLLSVQGLTQSWLRSSANFRNIIREGFQNRVCHSSNPLDPPSLVTNDIK